MTVAIVDNHDSYTWNLQQLCWELTGRRPTVVRNDETTADALLRGGFTHFVISPGPGTPLSPRDFGLCAELIRRTDVPLLGVCLGHQGIAAAYGGRIGPAPTVMHGRRSRIRHDGTGLYAGLPPDFPAVRYHSLAVTDLPAPLVATARTADGVLMGLSHRDRPLHGVQFHPESVGTPDGGALLANFLGRTRTVVDLGSRPAPRARLTVRWTPLPAVPPVPPDVAFRLDGTGRYSYFGWSARETRSLDDLRPVGGVDRAGYPLPFVGGWVGHLSYEGEARFGWVDRFVAVDHAAGRAYAVGLGVAPPAVDPAPPPPPEPGGITDVRSTVDRATYRAHLAEIAGWLARGESYEACYTYRIRARLTGSPLAAYQRLRAANPAPYGAYLRFGGQHVLCSSPERFLTLTADGHAETRPIKGTAARDPGRDHEVRAALAADEKNRAENLMIVDLLRNDLGRVCRPGTVRVPALMTVETYATVHHLVSTVTGELRPDVDAVDCLRALFPGGSMTGAPKERTVELLAGLETTPRGVYSGCLGWVGADGAADLAIVIRTAVVEGDEVTVGTGSAVTVLSDVDDEWAETRVKALAVLEGLGALVETGPRDRF